MTSPINPEAPKDPSQDIPGIQPTAPHEAKGPDDSTFSQMLSAPKGVQTGAAGVGKAGGTSPMELPGMGRASMPTKADEQSVVGAMENASGIAKEVQSRLAKTQTADLDRSKQYLLDEKLQSANQHIEAIAKQAGIDPKQFPLANTKGKGPLAGFLSLLDHGQKLLQSAQDRVPQLAKDGKLNTADFLSMQMKLSVAMVELDFSSQLLGKTGDAISKLMNVNI